MNKRDLTSRPPPRVKANPSPVSESRRPTPAVKPGKAGEVAPALAEAPSRYDVTARPAEASAPASVRAAASTKALGPLDDLLFLGGSDVKALTAELKRRGPEIRQHAQLKADFAGAFEAFE